MTDSLNLDGIKLILDVNNMKQGLKILTQSESS